MTPSRFNILTLALFLTAATASAAVTITSVTPSTGSTTGGTEVIIRGTGFTERVGSPSLPPGVAFDATSVSNVVLIDETTIRVITPPHLPGLVSVSVHSGEGSAAVPAAFTYLSDGGDDHFERILLPLLTGPVRGAFGSEFHTVFLADTSRFQGGRVAIYGLSEACPPPPRVCATPDPTAPLMLPSAEVGPLRVIPSGTPGRFIYVPDAQLPYLSLHLRVQDVTRAFLNFGTEMPIVGEHEFASAPLVLLGVPLDERFRNTLRLYSTQPISLRVTVEDQVPVNVQLTPGRNIFEPAYAVFTQFPTGMGTVKVSVEPTPALLPVVPPAYWGFIAVTNNETQVITTITPGP